MACVINMEDERKRVVKRLVESDKWPDKTNTSNGKFRLLPTIGNVRFMFKELNIKCRYNLVKNTYEVTHGGVTYEGCEKENDQLANLQSLCAENQLKISDAHLRMFVGLISRENPYHPVLEWVESQSHTKKGELDKFLCLFKTTNDELNHQLLLKWMITIYDCMCINEKSTKGVQCQGFPIFIGEQGWNKTRLIDYMLPPKLEATKKGVVIDPTNKDSIWGVASNLLVELGEIEQVFGKRESSSLKAYFTDDMDFFRKPFAPGFSRLPRKTTFFGTTNTDDFFKDHTGNRRFWAMTLKEKIHLDPEVDIQQVWAEVKYLADNNLVNRFLDSEQLQKLEKSNLAHMESCDIADAMFARIDWKRTDTINFIWCTAYDLCVEHLGLKVSGGRSLGKKVRNIIEKIQKIEGITIEVNRNKIGTVYKIPPPKQNYS